MMCQFYQNISSGNKCRAISSTRNAVKLKTVKDVVFVQSVAHTEKYYEKIAQLWSCEDCKGRECSL
jgi:hypothetical protein